jgi:AraC-like DNA-binding protein/mannose-6-phosphate isomerase-like protein (cupin superfamily)
MRVTNEKVVHPDESLRFLRFEVARFAAGRHRHRHLELTWVERGRGSRYVGDDIQPFGPDDLVLVGPGVPHCWISARGDGPCVATVVQFPPELLAQEALPELRALVPLGTLAARGLLVGGASAESVRALLVAMRAAAPLARLGLLLEALSAIAQGTSDRSALARRAVRAPSPRGAQARVDRVLDWIRRHYPRRLRIADAARIAHVSPRAFSRFFRREVGKTFVAYVNDVRCSEARVRLAEPSARIEDVARACGFPTLSNFNAQFRRRTGRSPREYRRAPELP